MEKNLQTVNQHFESEMSSDLTQVISTYTDDIVWEAPGHPNGEVHRGKADVEANYDWILQHVKLLEFKSLERFAADNRVVDDGVILGEVIKDGFVPFPVGKRLSFRILHVFDMQDGLICKERAFLSVKPT